MASIFKFEQPEDSTGFLLWKISNYWQREIRKVLKTHQLTHTQFVVLAGTFWLSENSKNVTQVEIAKHLEIDKMMTSNVLRTLEKEKLIARKEHKTDTRAKAISLTEKGKQLLILAVKDVEEFDTQFFNKLKSKPDFNQNLLTLLSNSQN